MNFLLKAKHWQLFVAFFVPPVIAYIVMMVKMFTNIAMAAKMGVEPDPLAVYSNLGPFYSLFMLGMIVYYSWIWQVNVGLEHKVPQQAKTNLTRFKILFCIPLIYFVLLFIWMAFFMGDFMAELVLGNEDSLKSMGIGMMIITPLHLLSIFCVFYLFYFTAKTLKTIELRREVSFSDFVAEFFLVWFLPVGIWFLQPKINKIVESEDDVDDTIVPPPVTY